MHGPLTEYSTAKSFSFQSCEKEDPGTLTVHGSDNEKGNNCYNGGLMMYCKANDDLSPWNNFVTDRKHWRAAGDYQICPKGDGWMAQGGSTIPDIAELHLKGAEVIWIDAADVTFFGSPKLGNLDLISSGALRGTRLTGGRRPEVNRSSELRILERSGNRARL